MSKMKGAIVIDTNMCKGCSLCVVACPMKILVFGGNIVHHRGYRYILVVEEEKCTGCASCAIVCPDSCISVYRKKEEV